MVRSKAKGVRYYYLARMGWELSSGAVLYYWYGLDPFKGDMARNIKDAAKFKTRKEMKEFLAMYEGMHPNELEGSEIVRMTRKEYFKALLQEKK